MSEPGEDAYFGHGVDADTGTLADMAAVHVLATWDYQQLEDVYIPAQLPDGPAPGAPAPSPTNRPADVVIVSSGWGDGFPTFIGYTAEGDVSSFVTDFVVVPWVIA